jgi:hypothetical protein
MCRHCLQSSFSHLLDLAHFYYFLFALAKQANGQLRCLGSAQHLKSKFGSGYQVELKVQHVNLDDADFERCVAGMLEQYPTTDTTELLENDDPSLAKAEHIYFNIDEAKLALERWTGDTTISSMVEASDPIGYAVWKEATSSPLGVDLFTLADFATSELRMFQLVNFIERTFPKHILRERQDTKARYEVDSDGVKISSIFASIEENKGDLRLEDYCVSQTSLEQVFNVHAEEAERLKAHQGDS